MINISFNIRSLIDKRDNRIIVRVRWNHKQYEVGFTTGMYAELEKWDMLRQRATKNTVHRINGNSIYASEINECLDDFQEVITTVFSVYGQQNRIPTTSELKEMVNAELGRNLKPSVKERDNNISIYDAFEEFLKMGKRERNWDMHCCNKYIQAYHHITAAVPKISPYDFSVETMYQLKDWYIENGYNNRTVVKQTNVLKVFLRWLKQRKGIPVPDEVLNFSTNLKVVKKTVTHLTYEELLSFYNFKFEGVGTEHIAHARDLWCFMAFTSLRYSDLKNLRTGHISGNMIEMTTQKTCDRIVIPLIDEAMAIINRYKRKVTDDFVFDVPSNQKLNDYIKEAARIAGLNRLVVSVNYIGMNRIERQSRFCDIISCHDARSTFVSCSLAMGIPPQAVMKCTGHKGYNTMKPYIETATGTLSKEMEKWNRTKFKSQIMSFLDNADDETLAKVLNYCKQC